MGINEELVLQAQQGNKDALARLWECVSRLYYKKAFEAYQQRRKQMERSGVALEDIKQECFLAFHDSVKTFDPAKGYLFTSWIHYPLQTHINALLRRRGKPEPMNSADRLDDLLPGADSMTLEDTIIDPSAEEALQTVDDAEFNRQLHVALKECIATLPQDRQTILEKKYFEGETLSQIASELGCSIPRIQQKAFYSLRDLRRGKNRKKLLPFAEEIIASAAYIGTGWGSWRRSGSVEERLTEWKEQKGWE